MTTPHQLPFGTNSPKSSDFGHGPKVEGSSLSEGFYQPAITLSALDTARRMVDAASDKKAQDIILLDVRKISSLADYFVICTASVERQIRAVAEAVEEVLDDAGVPVYHREGSAADGWTLLDYGDVIIHIFSPSQRDFYRLEQLWEMAHIVVRVQ